MVKELLQQPGWLLYSSLLQARVRDSEKDLKNSTMEKVIERLVRYQVWQEVLRVPRLMLTTPVKTKHYAKEA